MTLSAATPSASGRVVFVNPSSGPADADVEALKTGLPGYEVIECDGAGLDNAIAGAVAGGADVIGAAGGDGSLSCAAQHLVGTDVALLVIPEGTRNHFAHDIGVDDFESAQRAAADGRRDTVDVGDVNGRVFINNASLGVYARVVRKRERYERRLTKRRANLVAAWNELRHGHHFTVQLDGKPHRVWAVFVGNGSYGEELRDVTKRSSLQQGCLDVWVVRADGRLSRLRVAVAVVFGRLDRSAMIDRFRTASLEVSSPRSALDVACDGEVVTMTLPLRFSVRARALTVLLPAAQ